MDVLINTQIGQRSRDYLTLDVIFATKRKRVSPSHKAHPQAACPHPTQPLRPPGSRAQSHVICTTKTILSCGLDDHSPQVEQ